MITEAIAQEFFNELHAQGLMICPNHIGSATLGLGKTFMVVSTKDSPGGAALAFIRQEEIHTEVKTGDGKCNFPDDSIAVQLVFTNSGGIDALEKMLRAVRALHFPKTVDVSAVDCAG